MIDAVGDAFREPLVRAADFGLSGRNHYAHSRNPPYWRAADGAIDALLVRTGVGARLARVNAVLAQADLMVFLHDAWRPRAVQAYFFETWAPAAIRRRFPDMSEAEARAEARKYWAPPSAGPMRPAPHETGGAVDLTLAHRDGDFLWMGSLFDDPSEVSYPDRFEGARSLNVSDEEARANRRLLHWVMTDAGFCANSFEWWHFSFGDHAWARAAGAKAALYGAAAPAPDLLAARP